MLLQWLGKYKDFGLLILRTGIGASFFYVHGLPKMLGGQAQWEKLGGAMGNLGVHSYPVVWGFLSALAETGGGVLLILGYQTRLTCLFLTFNMFVASYMLITKGGMVSPSYPIEIGIVFLALLFLGAGKYSLDKN